MATGNATVLNAAPAPFVMYSYEPTNNTLLSPYIYSYTGKTNIKPLNTSHYFVGANGGSF